MQQQTHQLQMQQQGYLMQQQQRQHAQQAGYGGGGYRGLPAANAADSALARRLQEEEMAGEELPRSQVQLGTLPRGMPRIERLCRIRKLSLRTCSVTASLADIARPWLLGLETAGICIMMLRTDCCCLAGARPRRQAANQASKRFKSYSSDEDSDTSAETVPSEEEDSDDSNAGGKKKSKAAKARAVRRPGRRLVPVTRALLC